MEFNYDNYTLVSITDKNGIPHENNWRDKYLNHTGRVQFMEDREYPDIARMVFTSYKGGGLICTPGKKHIEHDKITVITTNSIYTFERNRNEQRSVK